MVLKPNGRPEGPFLFKPLGYGIDILVGKPGNIRVWITDDDLLRQEISCLIFHAYYRLS